MKRTIRILWRVVTLISVLIVLRLLVNVYLYFTYEHGNIALTRADKENTTLKGRWKVVYDTFEHGYDERHHLRYDFDTDSTGIFYYDYYNKRIHGEQSETYSILAVLPYSEGSADSYKTRVRVEPGYLVHIPGEKSPWPDTVFVKYELHGDSLFVDRQRRNYRYRDAPKWGMEYSFKPRLIDVILTPSRARNGFAAHLDGQ